jgi:hypothetical protein
MLEPPQISLIPLDSEGCIGKAERIKAGTNAIMIPLGFTKAASSLLLHVYGISCALAFHRHVE